MVDRRQTPAWKAVDRIPSGRAESHRPRANRGSTGCATHDVPVTWSTSRCSEFLCECEEFGPWAARPRRIRPRV